MMENGVDMTDVFSTAVRTKIRRAHPDAGRWLDQMPDAVERCARRWRLDVGYPVDGVSDSLVLRAVRGSSPVVLKLAVPGPALERQVAILDAAAGRGYVRLLDADTSAGVLLLEALGQSVGARIVAGAEGRRDLSTIFADTLQRAWQVPSGLIESGPHPAVELRRTVQRLGAGPAGRDYEAVVSRALAYADQRLDACDPTRQVLCHGDPHPWHLCEVLQARPGAPAGVVFVDPIGVRCEPEYDLAVVTREGNRSILTTEDAVVTLRAWCAALAETTDTDAEAIWQWSYLLRVARGLHFLAEENQPDEGRLYLQTAAGLIVRRR